MSAEKYINIKLKVWRQNCNEPAGRFEDYTLDQISTDASFLEMMDVLNKNLIKAGKDPIAFDHDCREGICGSCAMVVNGNPHGPQKSTTTCQLHMRAFKDGETIVIEPFRAKAFPVIKDLSVDRTAFDNIIKAAGYVSVNTGNAPDANALPIPKEIADVAFNNATCIGCGACVAACANGSAMLFVSAKVTHLGLLPQGVVQSDDRVLKMVNTMQEAGFGNCSNTGACAKSCPKDIPFESITRMNRKYVKASLADR